MNSSLSLFRLLAASFQYKTQLSHSHAFTAIYGTYEHANRIASPHTHTHACSHTYTCKKVSETNNDFQKANRFNLVSVQQLKPKVVCSLESGDPKYISFSHSMRKLHRISCSKKYVFSIVIAFDRI